MSNNKINVENKMFIFCEGSKTEPYYLLSYIEEYAQQKTKVISIPKTRKNTPIQLVEEAIKKKKSNDSTEGDVFWVVFDRESTAKYPDKKHQEARQKAAANNINIAISNVCFEFWLILHFEETTQSFSSYDNLMKESRLKEHLERIGIKNYDKGSDELYFKIKNGISLARKRAKRVNLRVAQSSNKNQKHQLNPYTNIDELLDNIDSF